ncbi:hypothetical protein LC55x_1636 [Lysobacter capsici]|uniref:hypothetical protein n=1 Tax=Lysobacter capsici TaxID=435897 RepID=UPI000716450A|nr:hypothetical protein [Lysobacter capsici]ALN84926.1 hypothetical protein LC55x_1636 [Lysobacter capsici]
MLNQPIAWLEGKSNYVAAESLSPADAPRQLTATDHLATARAAWRAKREAEATLSRLRKYSSLNSSMKADRDRANDRLSKADATLKRVLGGAS